MTGQYYFETAIIECRNDPRRVRALTAKREARNEAREQREIEINRRTATQLRTMIAGLEREIANLDVSINSELALASVRESSHFAYSILAKTMRTRRENMKTTIAALSDRLALTDVSEAIATQRAAFQQRVKLIGR